MAGWRVVGAAVSGTSHERLGLPCQDALAYQSNERSLLVALSDGFDRTERSEYGADCGAGCHGCAGCRLVKGLPGEQAAWDDLLHTACTAARSALESLAEIEEQPLAGLRRYAQSRRCNGGPAGSRPGSVMEPWSPENRPISLFLVNQARGEYANETYFLTQEDALERVQASVYEKAVNYLAVMSDGLTRLALQLPAQEPHLPFFQPLFAFAARAHEEEQAARHLVDFLNSERVCDRTDDDKSLVLAVRLPEPEFEPEGEVTPSE
jgi:hypothetical protein